MAARGKAHGRSIKEIAAEEFRVSVGIGRYSIDLHPSASDDKYLDIPALPFQIPLGAHVPQRTESLLPACKNLGATHITNGRYRLHRLEWNVGETAGALAALCLANKGQSCEERNQSELLKNLQDVLADQGSIMECATHWCGLGGSTRLAVQPSHFKFVQCFQRRGLRACRMI